MAFLRMGCYARGVVVAVTLLPTGGALLAQDTTALTLSESIHIAEARSRQLVAEDDAAISAREQAAAAALSPDPTLTVGINNLPINGPDAFSLTRDFMTMRSIGLSRELTHGDKRDARAARFELEAQAAEAGRTLALANLQRDTAVAWVDRHYRERMEEVLASQRAQAALQVEAADLAYRGGRGPQSDVFAARLAVAVIEDRMAAAQRDTAIATTKLERWIGGAAGRPLSPPPAMCTVSLSEADLNGELAHHPEIAFMRKQEEVARADAEVARTEKRSNWTVELMYSQRGPDFSNMMSLNASKPLQWHEKERQDRELAARLATADRMRALREEETRAHVADAHALLQAWQSNRARVERYASSLIPLASERTTAATAAYRGGTGSLGAVLDARVSEIGVRLNQLELEMATAELWAELSFIVPADHSAASHE